MVNVVVQASISPKELILIEEMMEELKTTNFSKAFREIVCRYGNYKLIIEAYKKESHKV